jgi:uncharacterized protein (DUF305 family)
MERNRAYLAGVIFVAVAAIAACGGAATDQPGSASTTSWTTSDGAANLHNQADVMFARHMIPHHQQAIEMSDIITTKSDIDPRVIELAGQIKSVQAAEIQQMQAWLDQWGMAGMPGMDGMPGMHGMPGMPGMESMPGMQGMVSPADMQAIRDAQGVDAMRLFLLHMIKHHEGAIDMANNEIESGRFPEAIALSESIVTSQRKEIDVMNQILRSL